MVGKFPAADSVSGKAKVLAFRYNGVNVFFLYSLLTSTAAANFVLHVFKALLEGRELRIVQFSPSRGKLNHTPW